MWPGEKSNRDLPLNEGRELRNQRWLRQQIDQSHERLDQRRIKSLDSDGWT
jgi:hypothetical protein